MKGESMREEPDGQVKRWDYKGLYVEHSTKDDALYVARHLRGADRREVSAITKQPPLQVIRDGIDASSPCYTIRLTYSGKPCGIFGSREAAYPQSGLVWLVGTDDLITHSTTFLRHSRQWLATMHEHYRLLYNVIDARNEVHLRWLEWLGFEFIQDVPRYGVERRKFILFRRYV
jgi:hypothetical protein